MAIPAAIGLARILKAEKVPWVSTYPVCGVNNALGEEGMPLLMMRDDRYAVALADAFSRVTNGTQIGVCTVMGGLNAAGVQVAFGAFAQAFLDGSRFLCITDGIPAGATGTAGFDIGESMRPVTKWIGHIDQPHRTPEIMRRAFTMLRTGRPGPVIVTIPRLRGDQLAFAYDEEAYPYKPVKGWKSAPDPADVKEAVKALLAADRPLIYAGEGVLYADAADELRTFAELVQAPVLTTLKAKSVFPENHPLSVGVRGELAAHFLNGCDLVFAIGSSLSLGHFRQGIPNAREKTVVQCVVDETDVNRAYQTDLAVIGDAGLTLQAIIEEVSSRTDGPAGEDAELVAEISTVKGEFMSKYRPLLESDDVPINPYRVYGDLQKTLDPNNSFLTHESGTTRDQLSTVYETVIPRGFVGWGNISTLGFSLAATMAAKLAYPERQCVAVTGDAGLSYFMGNLEVPLRCGVALTVVHINNGGFAAYGPGFWGPGHDPYTYEVSDHTKIDMAAAVAEMGYYSERVTAPPEVIPALKRALEQNADGTPAYLEIICSQYPVFGGWVAPS